MGGGNAQKSAAARLKNLKDKVRVRPRRARRRRRARAAGPDGRGARRVQGQVREGQGRLQMRHLPADLHDLDEAVRALPARQEQARQGGRDAREVLPGPQGLRPGEPGRGAPASRVRSARRARARSAGGGRARRAARARRARPSSPRAAARLDRPASKLVNNNNNNKQTFSFVGQSRRRDRRRAREEEEGREEGGQPRGPPLRGPQRRRQEEEVGSPVIRSRVDVWDALERSFPLEGESSRRSRTKSCGRLKKRQHDGTMPQ